MKRVSILFFGVASYGVFFLTFLYLIAFLGNLQQTGLVQWLPWLPQVVPYSVDYGRETGSMPLAVVINLGLIVLFSAHHSVAARMGFKAWLKRFLPASAERSVYILVSSLILVLLFWQWRPIPEAIWASESTVGQTIGWLIFAGGFGLVLLATFLIDHFDLFGLKQVWRQFVGKPQETPRFVTPLLYRVIRHPLYVGWFLAFWGGPVMTVGHLLLAALLTAYILIAIQFEERDLVHHLGERYARYRQQVPMLIPRPGRRIEKHNHGPEANQTDPSR